jgi:asparagine synthase (glutamine-hydrolysing)
MCGIAGILRIHDPKERTPPPHLESIPEAWLDTLDESIKHRGPDGAGRFRDRATRSDGITVDVALVHRRLSILDHAGGHQPMVHDGERLRPDLTYQPGETPILAHEVEPTKPLVAVVLNGCIYNHGELRKELEAKGHVFETDHSDTEVLVHGAVRWTRDIAAGLDSMHAFAIWSRADTTVRLSRDRAGQKPLYMSVGLEVATACFGSAAPGLARINALVDTDAVRIRKPDFFGSDIEIWVRDGRAPETPLEWISEIVPGSEEILSPGKDDYSVRVVNLLGGQFEPPMRDAPATAEDMRRLIERSVASHLDADVPLGVFLSGGIDSGLIAAIAKLNRPDIKTFTVRMPDAHLDESEAAAATARYLGTDHHTLDCDPHPADDTVHLIHQLGLPFGDSSLLPTYWVSRAAREHVKVALAGDGGDELFGGYKRHAIAISRIDWSRLARLVPGSALGRRMPSTAGEYLCRLSDAARGRGYPDLSAIFATPDLQHLIGVSFERRLSPEIRSLLAKAMQRAPVSRGDPLLFDFNHYLPGDLLRKTDTASMSVALEVRAPFLARELVEAALRTPLSVLMPSGERKGLLKQVARRYLPEHIINRPKQGFAIPIGEWFRTDYGSMRTLLYDHIESAEPFPGLAEAGVNINMDFVRRMLREHDAAGEKSLNPWHGRDHSQRLYMLLVLSIWAKWLEGLRNKKARQG